MPVGWDEDGVAELGFRLRRSAWGKGFATEGSRALIDKGFTELCVRRVVAETLAGNWASRRVLEKSDPGGGANRGQRPLSRAGPRGG